MNKLYRQVKLTDEEHDDFVFPHIMAMTGEKLHSKAEIAEELGVRDKRIAELKARVAELELWIEYAVKHDLQMPEWIRNSAARLLDKQTEKR